MSAAATLHELLDVRYGADGAEHLRRMLDDGADPNARDGRTGEAPLDVAARRRRAEACRILLERGADVDARNPGGKTAYAHAVRRGFDDVAEVLVAHGAAPALADADRLAVAVVRGRLDEARALLAAQPGLARTGNPEEDRLLADVAGRGDAAPVRLLVDAGADLAAPGLDGGTPLHQAAWFGQPDNARILVEAGAPLDVFDPVHVSSPIGWAAHGSGASGGAAERERAYLEIAELLLAAGASLTSPDDDGDGGLLASMIDVASPGVAALLRAAR